MNTGVRRVLFWSPRILGMLFALFLSLFALDVFGEDRGLRETLLALLIHLGPVYLVVIALAVSWRREGVGALLFPALAVYYVVWAWGRFPWITYAIISGPLVVIGVLFLLNWIYRVPPRPRAGAGE